MAGVNRINVVFVYAQDLESLRHFYESAFELGEPVIDAKWWVEYEMGDGSHLALHQTNPGHFEDADRKKNTVKFSIDVTGIHKFTERLKSLGARFIYEPRPEYGFQLAEFEDPEGNILRLYEKTKK